jgi:hypothetical protein
MLKLAPLLLIEMFVFGRAILASAQVQARLPQSKRSAGASIKIALPIVGALLLVLYSVSAEFSNRSDAAARVALLAIIGVLVASLLHDVFGRVMRAFRGNDIGISARQIGARAPLPDWPRIVYADFAIGIITTLASAFMLAWFAEAAGKPDVMLPPSVLVIPLVALVALPLGIGWIVIGIGAVRGKKWSERARGLAAVPTFVLVMMVAPMALALTKSFVVNLLKTL